MKRSKPLVGLLGAIVAAVAVIAGWRGWRLLTGRTIPSLAEGGAAAGEVTDPGSVPPVVGRHAPTTTGPAAEETIAEDEASSLAPGGVIPETAEELASLLPEVATPEIGDETLPEPIASEAAGKRAEGGVDEVLEVRPARAAASSLRERFGEGAFAPEAGGVCPEEHPIKGNSNSMIYHLPGQSSYAATMAEVCFADAAAAEAAGFRPRKNTRH